jgi:glycosyltransferase involved in cell wall biosynthesis
LLDTSPLLNASETRGIGTYTRELLRGLRQLTGLPEPLVVQATHEVGEILEPEKHFDLIHYPYFDLFFSTLPKKAQLPVVVTVHDVIPLVFPEQYPPGIKGRLRFWQQKRRLRQVEAVLTDSEASKRDIRQHLGVAESRLFVVPLAANPDLSEPTEYLQQKVKSELDLPNKFVLYVGDINYNKNLPTLLLALTQVDPSIHLCVVSQTFNNDAIPEGKTIADVIARNNLEERIRVLSIPKDQPDVLSAVISLSRCLVQPSLYEGFGLPVVEAMRVGTIVVSANTSSLPEVAGEAAILVDPTIAGLSDGITRAVGLRGEERQDWIRRGWKQAQEFSWEQTALQTYQVYEAARRFFAGEEK